MKSLESDLYSFKKISPFLVTVFIYLSGLATALILWGYHESFLFLNTDKIVWLDQPMFIITHLGDSLILVSILSLLLINKKPEVVISLIVVVLITGLTGQLLKSYAFEGWDRPLRHFKESPIVHTLPFYRLFHNSFPSGHSITAMSAFTTLVYGLKPGKNYQVGIALIACLVSYSRIYLGVHFPGDVLAGSLLGILLTLLIIKIVFPFSCRLNIKKPVRVAIFLLALGSLIAGTWLLRVYYPLI